MRLVCLLLLLPLEALAGDRDRDGVPDNRDECPDLPSTDRRGSGCPAMPAADPAPEAVDLIATPTLVDPSGEGRCLGRVDQAPLPATPPPAGTAHPISFQCEDGRLVRLVLPVNATAPVGLRDAGQGLVRWTQDRFDALELPDGRVLTPVAAAPPSRGYVKDLTCAGVYQGTADQRIVFACDGQAPLSLGLSSNTYLPKDLPAAGSRGTIAWSEIGPAGGGPPLLFWKTLTTADGRLIKPDTLLDALFEEGGY